MKNNFLIIIFIVFFSEVLSAENFDISAKNISIDKKNKITIFKENVVVQDEYNNVIKSDYASYDNKLQKLNIRGNITVQTSEGYNIDASEIELDENEKLSIIFVESHMINAKCKSISLFCIEDDVKCEGHTFRGGPVEERPNVCRLTPIHTKF